jgi:hypothetical protein
MVPVVGSDPPPAQAASPRAAPTAMTERSFVGSSPLGPPYAVILVTELVPRDTAPLRPKRLKRLPLPPCADSY